MFKPASTRAFRTFSRLPLRTAGQHFRHESTVKVQRVRFRDNVLSPKRLIALPMYLVAFYVFDYFVLAPIGEKAAKALDELPESPADEDEDDSLFIPMGFAKAKPRQFYKGSDPEWQEFKKFAADKQRMKSAREQLANEVRMGMAKKLSQHPGMARKFGEIDVTKGKFWLDVVFPDGPPQEYERGGIEISDDGIYWSKQDVTQQNYLRLQRAMYPTAVFNSLYASVQYLYKIQEQRIKGWLGTGPDVNKQMRQLNDQVEAMRKQMSSNGSSSQKESGSSIPADSARRSTAPGLPMPGSTNSPSSNGNKPVQLPEMPRMEMFAISVFTNRLKHEWKPLKLSAPRGTCLLTGMVEIQGSKARSTFDVLAAYDPKERRFVQINAQPRVIQERAQRPKGGP